MTRWRYAAATDTGLVRDLNEDAIFVNDSLAVVADGMGGHAAGEVASAMAVDVLIDVFHQRPTVEGLQRAIQTANDAIIADARDTPEHFGMGTTVIAVGLTEDAHGVTSAALFNIGDSRAYQLRDGALRQLSDDHSVAAEWVRMGRLTAEEAAVHPRRHQLTRTLGVEEIVEVDVMSVIASAGDRLLLCSDGLSNELSAEIIAQLASAPVTLEEAVGTLLDAAHGPRMHHAWLFAGPEGVGKAVIARAAATRLLAESAGPTPDGEGLAVAPDHPIARLIEAQAHSDFIWIERMLREKGTRARNIGVDQIRALGPKFALAPSHSPRRIVVIDAVDDLEKAAANALLKSLEEPPAHTVFLLISHAPGRLLPTIRSRCRMLHFAPLDHDAVADVVRNAHPDMDADELAWLVAAAHGAPGKALALAGLDLASVDAKLSRIADAGDAQNALRSALASEFAAKASQPRYEALLKRAPGFVAERASALHGPALARALAAYEDVSRLAATAPIHNLDPQSCVFEIGSIIATLAK